MVNEDECNIGLPRPGAWVTWRQGHGAPPSNCDMTHRLRRAGPNMSIIIYVLIDYHSHSYWSSKELKLKIFWWFWQLWGYFKWIFKKLNICWYLLQMSQVSDTRFIVYNLCKNKKSLGKRLVSKKMRMATVRGLVLSPVYILSIMPCHHSSYSFHTNRKDQHERPWIVLHYKNTAWQTKTVFADYTLFYGDFSQPSVKEMFS